MKPMNLQQKAKTRLSPQAAKVAGASLVALIAVGAIVLVAHQATPAATTAPAAKSATVSAPAPAAKPATAPAKAGTAKAKTANAKGAAQAAPEIVTITGCLEQKGDEYRLKDTGGTDAPKSRSWKTLGLTKHASAVSLVDSTNRLKLGSHVGERVSVTGPIVDKAMQGRSLKTLTTTCE